VDVAKEAKLSQPKRPQGVGDATRKENLGVLVQAHVSGLLLQHAIVQVGEASGEGIQVYRKRSLDQRGYLIHK
jgi:hypothetical protein